MPFPAPCRSDHTASLWHRCCCDQVRGCPALIWLGHEISEEDTPLDIALQKIDLCKSDDVNRGTVAPHGVNQGSDGRCSNSPQATKEKEVAGTGEDTQEHAQASTMAGTSASQHRRTPRVGAPSRSYLEKCRCQLEVHALGTAETAPGAVAGHRFPNLLLPDVMGCGGCGFRILSVRLPVMSPVLVLCRKALSTSIVRTCQQ